MKFLGKITVADNEQEWISISVDYISKRILKTLEKKERFQLAISGGKTPEKIFDVLINHGTIPPKKWENVDIFWVDERLVEISSDESNAGNAMNTFSKVSAKCFPMYDPELGEKSSLDRYKKDLNTFVYQRNGMPVFDLIILGMGEDGHTASLFPGTIGLIEQIEPVILHNVPQIKTERMTLTFPVLKHANELLILFHGKKKCELFYKIMMSRTGTPIEKLLEFETKKNWIFFE